MRFETLDRLIDTAYDTLVLPNGFGDFLLELAEVFGCTAPGIGIGGAGPGWQVFALAEDTWIRSYGEQYAAELAATAADGRLIDSSFPVQRLSREPWDRWAFHADWMRPQGLADGLGFYSSLNDGSLIGFAAYRERGQSGFDRDDLELIEELRPHLRRAVDVHRRVCRTAAARQCAEAILEHLEIGLVLLDEGAEVVFANDVARDIARRGDGLSLCPTGIAARDQMGQRRLEALVRDAMPRGRGQRRGHGGALRITRSCGAGDYELLVSPAPGSVHEADRRPAAVMVLIHDTAHAPTPSVRTLQELYALTGAEARVASELASGRSIDEIARAGEVSRQTVRNQLKIVFDKTDTHRQTELMHLVRGGVATYGSGDAE